MNYQALFAAAGGRRARAGLVGVGQFGVSLVSQSRAVHQLEVVALCDREVSRAVEACRRAGFDPSQYALCEGEAQAARALERGLVAIVDDAQVLVRLDLDVVVEATGSPEWGARTAAAALERGRHVAMASKEADSVVGALLAARAADAGLVYTPVDGDQPGLLMGLVSWARTLGLDIVCAGKSSEYDFVYDPLRAEIRWTDRVERAPELGALWALPEHGVADAVAARARVLGALPQRTVPDLCEMGMVINATGLVPDTPMFHVPVARAVEVPEVLRPRADGGVLGRTGVVDVFNCLRRPDEASFAGGVFVVVACHDRETWSVLRDKGHVVSRDGRHAMLYNPQHLLGLEAPISILAAALLGLSSAGARGAPQVDLVARAGRDLRAGEVLAITDAHHHEVDGLEPMLLEAAPATPGNAVPYYLATNRPLTRDVAAGTVLTCEMVDVDTGSALWTMRAEQDARFHHTARVT
jgi:predicted homoserine dehydrogenase-like protein